MTRKEFMKKFGFAVVAVSVVGLSSTKAEPIPILYGDGVHDDTEALQALFDGQKVRTADGSIFKEQNGVVHLPAGEYNLITKLRIL